MKTKNKVLLILTCMCLIVATTVMATVAYLADEDTVVNTFTVGNVQLNLDETDVDLNGKKDGETRVKANEYHLIPGMEYIKDPTVTVLAGSEECYVRMLVTLNRNKAQLNDIFGAGFLPQYYVEEWNNAVWQTTGAVAEDPTNNTVTYEFRYRDNVNKPETIDKVATDAELASLFKKFKVPTTLDGEDLAKLQDNPATTANEKFTITVVAHAIQAAGFNTEAEAWAAFDAQTQQP